MPAASEATDCNEKWGTRYGKPHCFGKDPDKQHSVPVLHQEW